MAMMAIVANIHNSKAAFLLARVLKEQYSWVKVMLWRGH